MFIDNGFSFANQQALTGTADVVSTNVFDAGSAKKYFGGGGKSVKVLVTISASGGTSPTLRARLVGATDAVLTGTPIIIADSGVSRVLTSADVGTYEIELVPALQIDAKRYYGVIFTQSGTNPTATVNANLVMDAQENLTGIGP